MTGEHPNWLCPRCKKREREMHDGEYEMFCGPCNDSLAESYRERQEFAHYHPED